MRRLLLLLPLFSSPVFAEENHIYYVHIRPPFSYSGTIGSDGFFYEFANSADSLNYEICKIRIDGRCFVKTIIDAAEGFFVDSGGCRKFFPYGWD